jgi:hypothetical protein
VNVQIRYDLDESGQVRDSLLVATVDGRPVASAARVAGSDRWVVVPSGPRGPHTLYEVVEGEQAARAALLVRARAQTGHQSSGR